MEYFEYGLPCFPCENKAPQVGNEWQKYCEEPPSEEIMSQWEFQYKKENQLGLILGEKTGIIAFDFDYGFDDKKCTIKDQKEFIKDYKSVEAQIRALLPPTPALKKGEKGWTAFYKWSPGLTNRQIDRNGIRLFDLLAWHKQTILPPSIHSSIIDNDQIKNLKYSWLGQPLYDVLDDLPYLQMETVEEIASLFSSGKKSQIGGRHGDLFMWLKSIITVESDIELLAAKLVEKDLNLHPTNPYLSDVKYNKRKVPPEQYAKEWIERIAKWLSEKAKHEGQKTVKTEVNNDTWDFFIEKQFSDVRKDILSEKIYVKGLGKQNWQEIVGIEKVLKCYARDAGLPASHVTDQLDRYWYEKDKLDLLVDIPEWDGVDYIQQFANCIFSDKFTHNDIANVFREWGVNLFDRVYKFNPNANQNFCIMFLGGQGKGKDTLVRHMFKHMHPYYDSVSLTGTQKDVLEAVCRMIIVHVEEWDQTANLPVPFIKDLITKPSAFFRESYGRNPGSKKMMGSWITTANVDDVLRDPSGNRRFVVVPIEKIEWKYPTDKSDQVIAQMYHLFKMKRDVSYLDASLKEKIKTLLDHYTPDSASDLILESYVSRASAICFGKKKVRLSYSDIESVVTDLSRMYRCGVRNVQSIIKLNGLQKRDGARRYYLASKEADSDTSCGHND
jgi:hypothetical protein